MKEPPYNALTIANYFLKKGREEGHLFSPMKLIKLVYFAQGWYLALFNNSLINEEIEAWQFGPVIPSLYHSYKKFGNDDITDIPDEKLLKNLNPFAMAFLNRIWEVYGFWHPFQLSNHSHEKGSPWDIAWHEQSGKYKYNHPIPNNLIKDYFSKKVA